MWKNTRLTKLLKIKIPLIQAPMAGGITTPELVAAVSNAGGLGSLGAGMSPDEIRSAILKIKSLTNKPFSVNLFVTDTPSVSNQKINVMKKILKKNCGVYGKEVKDIKPPYTHSLDEQLSVLIEEKIPVISFTFGIPAASWIKKLKQHRITLIGTATSVPEAIYLEKKGMDIVVAQGYEAGGHRATFLDTSASNLVGNFALIPLIADCIQIPVVAAGSIMDARGIVAALTLGAEGVQMGTAFIPCKESGALPAYKKILFKSAAQNTVLTRSFSGKWARGIENKFIKAMKSFEDKILAYPAQHVITLPIRKAAAKRGDLEYFSTWAGQGANLAVEMTANKFIQWLDKNTKKILRIRTG
jgi:nitronate monooxygenase